MYDRYQLNYGDHLTIYINIKSLCCTTKIHMLYQLHLSFKKDNCNTVDEIWKGFDMLWKINRREILRNNLKGKWDVYLFSQFED